MKKLTILLLVFLAWAGVSEADTYYVRTDGHDTNCIGTADASDASTETTACAWLTIQKAVNSMATGDTVIIGAGTYSENGGSNYLLFDAGENGKTLTLRGATGNAADVTITGSGSYDVSINGLTTGTINFKDLKISGSHVTQFIVSDPVTVNFDNVALVNNQPSTAYGIYVNDAGARVYATSSSASAYSTAVFLSNCSSALLDGGTYSITSTDTTGVINASSAACDLTIRNGATIGNRLNDNEIGISASSSAMTSARNIVIQDSTIYGFDRPIQIGTANSLTIAGNTIESWTTTTPVPTVMILLANGSYGVPGGPTSIPNISITGNTITGTGVAFRTSNTDFAGGHVAYLTSANRLEFSNNVVTAKGGFYLGQHALEVVVQNNEINHTSGPGIMLGLDASTTGNANPLGALTVTGNTVTATGAETSRSHNVLIGMGAGTEASPALVAYNSLNGGWYGLVLKGDYLNVHHNTVNTDKSLYLAGSQHSTISHNSLYAQSKLRVADDNEYALGLSGNQASEVSSDNEVKNNTIIAGATAKVVWDSAVTAADNNLIDRNAYWSDGTFDYWVKDVSRGGAIADIRQAWSDAYPGETYADNDQTSFISDPLLTAPSTGDFTITQFSPVIDAAEVDLTITRDFANHPIYGLPDIGAYEYQPPYDMDNALATSSVRVYGDEKWRPTTATTSADIADLDVGIEGSDKTDWLDVDISTWESDGAYQKTFTASTTVSDLAVTFTVGDLSPNHPYTLTIDGGTATSHTADENGEISFSYSGPWSLHTFDIQAAPELESEEREPDRISSGFRRIQRPVTVPSSVTPTNPTTTPVQILDREALVQQLQARIQVLLAQLRALLEARGVR